MKQKHEKESQPPDKQISAVRTWSIVGNKCPEPEWRVAVDLIKRLEEVKEALTWD